MRKHALVRLLTGISLLLAASCRNGRSALGPLPASALKDGTYSGTGTSGPVKVVANVRIANGRIAEIDLAKHRTWKGRAAEKGVPQRIIAAQSTAVDAVTGATYSSEAIMRAVQQAVDLAKQ